MALWLKAIHIISVIAWMAGLLYLPRLMVYHAHAKAGTELAETLKIMEWRLLRLIMNPAMIAVWITGPLLAWVQGMVEDHWLWMKFVLVLVLTGYHHALGRWRKELADGRSHRGPKFFRVANEIPTLLMIGIVVLVVVKPF